MDSSLSTSESSENVFLFVFLFHLLFPFEYALKNALDKDQVLTKINSENSLNFD